MKRRIRLAAIGALTALTLAACGGGGGDKPSDGGSTGSADDPVEISVSVWNLEGTPEFGALFDAFEAANPEIKIKPVDILAEDYAEKVTTMLAGGDKTDVLTLKNLTDYARWGNRGQLADISETVNAMEKDKLAGLNEFDLDGKYFGVPYRQDFWVLYYNRDLFDAAGLDYPENITWDEYAALAEKLTDDSGEQKVYGTYQHIWRSVVQAISAAQTGGDLLGGDYEFFTDQYTMALDLQDKGYTLDYGTAKTQQISYRTMFETGQAAMMPMGTWYVAGIKAAIDEGTSTVNWGVAPMPQIKSGDETVTFGSPTGFAVNKNSTKATAAAKFIEWAAGEEGAKAIAAIGVVPAFTSEAVTAAFTALPTDDLSQATFNDPKTIAIEMPVSEITSDVNTILEETHDLMMVKELSIPDGIAEMNKRVTDDVLANQ